MGRQYFKQKILSLARYFSVYYMLLIATFYSKIYPFRNQKNRINTVFYTGDVNGISGQLKSIPNFKITVKDSKKKVVASYKKSSYSVNVKSYSDKSYTVTIPKSALKKSKNKIDLRTSTITVSGKAANATL